MELEFNTILKIYDLRLENIRTRLYKKLITKEQADSMLMLNMFWFHELKSLFELKDYIEIDTKSKRICQRKKYEYKGEKPWRIIKYRGVIIPIYSDDYGQQDYTVYDGQCISGGAYNFEADKMFTDEIDWKLQDEYMNEEPSDSEKKKTFFQEMMEDFQKDL